MFSLPSAEYFLTSSEKRFGRLRLNLKRNFKKIEKTLVMKKCFSVVLIKAIRYSETVCMCVTENSDSIRIRYNRKQNGWVIVSINSSHFFYTAFQKFVLVCIKVPMIANIFLTASQSCFASLHDRAVPRNSFHQE